MESAAECSSRAVGVRRRRREGRISHDARCPGKRIRDVTALRKKFAERGGIASNTPKRGGKKVMHSWLNKVRVWEKKESPERGSYVKKQTKEKKKRNSVREIERTVAGTSSCGTRAAAVQTMVTWVRDRGALIKSVVRCRRRKSHKFARQRVRSKKASSRGKSHKHKKCQTSSGS